VLAVYCKHAQHCLIIVRAGHRCHRRLQRNGEHAEKENVGIDICSELIEHKVMEYRELESILAELHGVTQDDRGKFRARLRILRDIGVPAVMKPGKGSRVTYQFLDLWEVHLGLLLVHFGLPPAQVKFVLEDKVGWLGWYEKMRELEKQTTADIWAHVMYFRHSIEDETPGLVTLIKPLDDIFLDIKCMDEKKTVRAAVIGLINLSKLTRECALAMPKHVK
jgi:hypothetical protein